MFSTKLLALNYLLYSPTDAAPDPNYPMIGWEVGTSFLGQSQRGET